MNDRSITIAYALANRGRNLESFTSSIQSILDNNRSIIIFIDESDQTDIDLGYDGRGIFNNLKKYSKQLKFHISEDRDVGINIIYKGDLEHISTEYVHINKSELLKPQGRSERYHHYRCQSMFTFQGTTLNFVVQHNNAFIRPFSRGRQSVEAMRILNKSQADNPNSLCFLIRDQNTFIPGEGRYESYLRRSNCIFSVTESVVRKYQSRSIENDTGGLNKVAHYIANRGILDFIDKYIIRIANNIESICLTESTLNRIGEKIVSNYKYVEGMDHGILYITIDEL